MMINNMKHLKFIPLALLVLTLFGCPDKDPNPDSTITIVNRSDKTLLFYFYDQFYPDTTLQKLDNPFDETIKQFAIKPNSIEKRDDLWRSYLSKPTSTGVMTIFLFDKAIVDTVAWDKIREDYLVAKRYEYTLEQLDSLNWTITYP